MPRTILGKVSLTPKGEYSPDTAYTALDVVNYGGSSWLALQDVTGVAPAEGENWMLLAQKGDQGASFTRLEKTAGTGAPGTTDTYTAYNSEGQAAGTVQVYNGMDGTGAGDFKADGTVPMTGNLQMAQHRVTGVADATEDGDAVNKGQMDAALEGVTVTTDPTPTQDSANPVQSGGVFDALAGKADLTLSNLSNYQTALRNTGGRPSRNLLDNWYFAGGGSQQGDGQFPINQRGQTSYTAASANCIDRWKLFNSDTLALEADAIALTSRDTGTSQLRQILSAEAIEQIKGRTVTLSVLTTQGLFSGPFTISPDGSSISGERISMGDWYADLYANPSISKIEFRFVSLNPNATLKIRAVKLELGSIQTLACQDEAGGWQLFETPDYGAELAKCQRYLWSSNLGKRNYSCLGAGVAQSASILYLPVSLPVPMRENVNPTVSMQDQTHFRLRGSGSSYNDIVSSISYDGTNGSVVSVFLTGQFTQGQAYIVYTRNADALLLSCEL